MLACGPLAAAKPDGANDAEFLRAVGRGDLTQVRSLLDSGANINTKGINGYFALEGAIDQANTEIAKLLLERGADVNLSDDFGTTALIAAAKNARTEMIEPLLTRHADLHASRDAAIIAAVGQGNIGIFARLLAAGADPKAKDEDGRTLLMRAIYSPDMTKLLVEHGATLEPNAADKNGVTLLMYAAAGGTLDTVKLLLVKGGDIKARDHEGRSLLMNLPLNSLGTSSAQLEEMIAFVVAKGVDVNARDHTGATALHRAVEAHLTEFGGTSAHASVVRALLAAGADPNLANDNRQTPLMLVAASAPGSFPERAAERTKIISMLKRAGAHE